MFGNYLKNITIIVALTMPCKLLAEDVGDNYYPAASDNTSSATKIEQDHQLKMLKAENEHKARITALEKRYNEKNITAAAYTNKMIELRQKSAQLKEERMKTREEQEEAFMKRSQQLHTAEFEKSNQYVINTKERNEYFAKKNKEHNSK